MESTRNGWAMLEWLQAREELFRFISEFGRLTVRPAWYDHHLQTLTNTVEAARYTYQLLSHE